MSTSQNDPSATAQATEQQPVPQDTQQPACENQAPKGFEEFDLDDIEVIESKVFA